MIHRFFRVVPRILAAPVLGSRIPDPSSAIPDPRSPILDPRSPILDPRSTISIPDRRSGIRDWGSRIGDRGFGTSRLTLHGLRTAERSGLLRDRDRGTKT